MVKWFNFWKRIIKLALIFIKQTCGPAYVLLSQQKNDKQELSKNTAY